MGHIVNSDREYRLLQQRLDRNVTGAPESPAFMKILELLFSPEEAVLASRLPTLPTDLQELSLKLNVPADELDDKLTEMAGRGLVMDFELNGSRCFTLNPVVIGFFEFTFMRVRDDLPMRELAGLFDEYMKADDRFARSVFTESAQIGRSLVHEEAPGIPGADSTEILDWERSTHLIKSASAIGVSLCSCRHKAMHLGKACDRSLRNCLTLNYAAESLIRNGIAERIPVGEAMRILEESKSRGLAQTGDNVQRKVSYICNCCGCCCGMMSAINTFNIKNAIVSSNWIMQIDQTACDGCLKCVKACPVKAIHSQKIESSVSGAGCPPDEPGAAAPADGKRKKYVVQVDESLCLGCGVCTSRCKTGAISMRGRERRVFTPETLFDRIVVMAIERGKLSELIMDRSDQLGYLALGRIVGLLEKAPPFQALAAIEPLKSAYLAGVVEQARAMVGPVSEVFTG